MFEVKEILDITEGTMINGNINSKIEQFNINRIKHNKGDFYIPIFCGEDRHKYIIDAVKSGAVGYMISDTYEYKEQIIKESMTINPEIIIVQVKDINKSIYDMAKFRRNQNIDIPIIVVTGSVGKTTTKEMIASIISQEKNVLSDRGNNNTLSLLSRLLLNIEDYEIAVLEAGMARKGVMNPISELLRPSIVVINNIGTSHIGNLGSKEAILEEKLKLIDFMKDNKVVFLNNNDFMLKNVTLDDSYNIKRYSIEETRNVRQNGELISFETMVYGENVEFNLNAYGEHSVSNAICAIRIAEYLNIKKENIQKGISTYVGIDRRFKVIRKNENVIIDDTYNASFDSMKAGLISADQIRGCKRKIAILGDMLELGDYSKDLHEQVGEIFKDVNFDMLLTQGENTMYICNSAQKYMKNKIVMKFDSQEELIQFIKKERKSGDLLYLKASRKMNFDKIVNELII